MPIYFVKNQKGEFFPDQQPEGFVAGLAIENCFFYCTCPTKPDGDFVVEAAPEFEGNMAFYGFRDGHWLPFDAFAGRVERGEEVDKKGRRQNIFTQEQKDLRAYLLRWVAINVFIPDKLRLFPHITAEDAKIWEEQINEIEDAELVKKYITKNLYYDLYGQA